MLSRNVEISGFRTSVHISAVHGRGEEPEIESKHDSGRPRRSILNGRSRAGVVRTPSQAVSNRRK